MAQQKDQVGYAASETTTKWFLLNEVLVLLHFCEEKLASTILSKMARRSCRKIENLPSVTVCTRIQRELKVVKSIAIRKAISGQWFANLAPTSNFRKRDGTGLRQGLTSLGREAVTPFTQIS